MTESRERKPEFGSCGGTNSERAQRDVRPPARVQWMRGLAAVLPLVTCLLVASAPLNAATSLLPGKKGVAQKAKATPPEEALNTYVTRVRSQHDAEVRSPGSIWVDQGRLVRLSTDAKAARLYDVVTIVVTESIVASTDGQVKNSRASNANSGLTGLFGALSAKSRLQNLLGQNSSSGLTAQGQSDIDASMTTTFGGEVVDVLPNGMLVVQATRQLTFSQQTQLIRLRGLVRPEDVSAQNQVLSTAMTDLELEVTGKGIINDYTYRQNPIWRFLQRLLVF
jgi:flagellar L-ring protein precursor FlgH